MNRPDKICFEKIFGVKEKNAPMNKKLVFTNALILEKVNVTRYSISQSGQRMSGPPGSPM